MDISSLRFCGRIKAPSPVKWTILIFFFLLSDGAGDSSPPVSPTRTRKGIYDIHQNFTPFARFVSYDTRISKYLRLSYSIDNLSIIKFNIYEWRGQIGTKMLCDTM